MQPYLLFKTSFTMKEWNITDQEEKWALNFTQRTTASAKTEISFISEEIFHHNKNKPQLQGK